MGAFHTFTWHLCYGFFLQVHAMPLVGTDKLMLGMPVIAREGLQHQAFVK